MPKCPHRSADAAGESNLQESALSLMAATSQMEGSHYVGTALATSSSANVRRTDATIRNSMSTIQHLTAKEWYVFQGDHA
jgi:hypothetical protein